MNNLFFSSSCFKTNKFNELIVLAEKNQVYNLELSGNLVYEPQVEMKLKKEKRFNWLIHNYFPRPKQDFVLNLASKNKKIRLKSINHCLKSIKLCQKLKIPYFSVHAGFLADFRPVDLGGSQSRKPFINRGQGLRLFKNSVLQLLGFIEQTGQLDLLIENNVCSKKNLIHGKNKLYLLADLKETISFFNQMQNFKNLGLLLDCGHLNVSSRQLGFDNYKFIDKLADKIQAFHLNANNGLEDQNRLFTKKEWFIRLLKKPKFFKIPKVIEVSNNYKLSDILKLKTVLTKIL